MNDGKPKKPHRAGNGGERPMRRGRAPADDAQRTAKPQQKNFEGERIAKVMARAGACSRREAEEWIAAGRVAVNGVALTSPAFNVRETDKITVDGAPLVERERTRLFLFHKPSGLVTSAKDPENRETVFDYLARHYPDLPRVVSVGRLDINTEGLLLLTNDGGLARTLELPATGWTRRYRVRAHGDVDQAALDALKKGVTVDGVDYAPIDAKLDRIQGSNAWISMTLREGKNREIKRVLESLGLDVTRLIRTSFGPFQLGELDEGVVEEVRLKVLREQLGKGLAELAGVDFSSPLHERETAAEKQKKSTAQTQERPRKHVSALRAQRVASAEKGPRTRIEHGSTSDRKGRAVTVQKVVAARPKHDVETRNARNFRSLRRVEERAPQDVRAPRSDREDAGAPRRERPERNSHRRFESEDAGRSMREGRPREDAFRRREGSSLRGGERSHERDSDRTRERRRDDFQRGPSPVGKPSSRPQKYERSERSGGERTERPPARGPSHKRDDDKTRQNSRSSNGARRVGGASNERPEPHKRRRFEGDDARGTGRERSPREGDFKKREGSNARGGERLRDRDADRRRERGPDDFARKRASAGEPSRPPRKYERSERSDAERSNRAPPRGPSRKGGDNATRRNSRGSDGGRNFGGPRPPRKDGKPGGKPGGRPGGRPSGKPSGGPSRGPRKPRGPAK